MKKVLAAAIVKILEFDSPEEAREYLDGMKAAGKNFRIQWECDVAGNKRQIRITYQGFLKKINNESEFKASEIKGLQDLLNLTDETRDKIFFTVNVE